MSERFFIRIRDINEKDHYINLHEIKYFDASENAHYKVLNFYCIDGETFQLKVTPVAYHRLFSYFNRKMEAQ